MFVDLELGPFPVAIELASVVRLDFFPDTLLSPVENKDGADDECEFEFLEIGLGCSLVKGDGRAANRATPPLRGRIGEEGDSAGDNPGERGGDRGGTSALALDVAMRPILLLVLVELVERLLSI